MKQKHSIQKLIVELHIDREEHAHETQQEIFLRYQQLILDELEKLFDLLALPGEQILIDRLEIDIGAAEQLEMLPGLVRSQGEELLRKVIHEARSSASGAGEVNFIGEEGMLIRTQVQVLPVDDDKLSRISHFLQYGVFPASSSKENAAELIGELLLSSPEELREMLLGRNSYKRLVLQCGPALLRQLLRLLRPDDLRFADDVALAAEQLDRPKAKQLWEEAFTWKKDAASMVQQFSENAKEQESKQERENQPAVGSSSLPGMLEQLLEEEEKIKHRDITAAAAAAFDQVLRLSRVFMALSASGNPVSPALLMELLQAVRKLYAMDGFRSPAHGAEQGERLIAELETAYNASLKKAVEESDPEAVASELYVVHAGLVLVSTFFPAFFENAGLTENDAFISAEAREKAVHLLHYSAGGMTGRKEEQELVLHKILCGMNWDEPVDAEADLGEEQLDESDEMLAAFLRYWERMNQSSPDELRANFLLRQGRLERTGEEWLLTVETAEHDFLLDSAPAPFDLIALPWMEIPIRVVW